MTPKEAAKRLRVIASDAEDSDCVLDARAMRMGADALARPAIPERRPLEWERLDGGRGHSRVWTAATVGGGKICVGRWWGTWRWWHASEGAPRPDDLPTYSRPQDARRAAEWAVSRAMREALRGKP